VVDAAFSNKQPARAVSQNRFCSIVIDAEEDFDWNTPIAGTPQSTEHLRHLTTLSDVLRPFGAVPTYLLTYPALQDDDAIAIIRRQLEAGQCAVGLQLHPWVTPPFDQDRSTRASFAGNLDPAQEESKLLALKARFVARFGFQPTVFRTGRYGLGPNTPHLLEKHGFLIDTSIAPRTDFSPTHGPDFSRYNSSLFWFGARRRLLEVPLCRDIVGWGGSLAVPAYLGAARFLPPIASGLTGLLSRSRHAERITLSPEGNDLPAMQRLVEGVLAKGQTILPLSFHSSSLQPGLNPYVRTQADLMVFYERLSKILDYTNKQLQFSFVAAGDIPQLLLPPESATPNARG
jgi:hypothetical protein